MTQPRVSNIALINTKSSYANSVVNNDCLDRQNGKDSCFY